MFETTYRNEEFDGFFKRYYENGVVKEYGKFIDGLPSGQWCFYYSNGELDECTNL